MARRRKQRSSRRIWVLGSLATIAGVWAYGQFLSPVLESEAPTRKHTARRDGAAHPTPPADVASRPARTENAPQLTSSRPERPDVAGPPNVTEKGDNAPSLTSRGKNPDADARAAKLLEAARQAETGGDLLAARGLYSDALRLGLADDAMIDVRAALTRIGDATIFSSRIVEGDTFVLPYTVQPGDSLGKIARRYNVTADLLAHINHIPDKNRIHVGQRLKIVRGPFHARVHKPAYTMDVFLQQTYVRHFPVGLGADDSTPAGEWIVGTKLENPTYYPPRGGRIIPADHSENPLGEYWIELVGVKGQALGQLRYGIHGTIDPSSIGQSASLGCIRMHNADVTEVFSLLVSKKSQVIVE